MKSRTVAVLAPGPWATASRTFSRAAGFAVLLRDVDKSFLDRGLETIAKNLDREVKKGQDHRRR